MEVNVLLMMRVDNLYKQNITSLNLNSKIEVESVFYDKNNLNTTIYRNK